MERRRFIVKAGGTLAAVGAVAVVDAPSVIAQPKIQWRLSTAYAGRSTFCTALPEALGQDRRGNEWRAASDRGVSGRPDHAALRVL